MGLKSPDCQNDIPRETSPRSTNSDNTPSPPAPRMFYFRDILSRAKALATSLDTTEILSGVKILTSLLDTTEILSAAKAVVSILTAAYHAGQISSSGQ